MKRLKNYLTILLSIIAYESYAQSGQWIWMKGDTIYNDYYNAPVLGVEDSACHPPALYQANTWQDDSGRLWLFGGLRYDPDDWGYQQYFDYVWRFNPVTNNWAIMRFTWNLNSYGEYGTLGVPDSADYPGGRGGSMIWKDHEGNIWLFGGTSRWGGQNDMWKYDMSTNVWTWMKGPDEWNHNGYYGMKGVESSLNRPPCRRGGTAWQDTAGNFWMFGGYYYGQYTGDNFYNDLWKFNPSTNNWIWMGGSNLTNQPGVYGIKGMPDTNNIPPAHSTTCYWTDDHNNFYMFGGDSSYPTVYNYSQVWRYNCITNEWTWLSGVKQTNVPGVSGTLCTPDSNNFPTPRTESSCIKIDSDRVLIFGGFVKWENGSAGIPHDAWIFNFKTIEWVKIWGDSLNFNGHFGTQGVADSSNDPPGRKGASIWKSIDGGIWLYGGEICNHECALSDLWKYIPDPNCQGIPTAVSSSIRPRKAKVYPNPTFDYCRIELPTSELSTIKIQSLTGATLFENKNANFSFSMDMTFLNSGIYLLSIQSITETQIIKLIKQ